MFGYIYPNKMELKIKDFYIYKGYYCGLCKTIKKLYGNPLRMSLNYDLTFLGMLLSSLYYNDNNPSENIIKTERCIASPFKKNMIIYNKFVEYSAHMNTLLTYYKLIDNYNDENSLPSLLLSKAFSRAFKKASKLYPQKGEVIKKNLNALSHLEQANSSSIDETSNCFGEITKEIFVFKDDEFSDILKNIGFHIGKIIYTLDAYEDLPDDIKSKSFNPLKNEYNNNSEKLKEDIQRILFIMLDFLSEDLKKLSLKVNNEIIENIVYSGLYLKATAVIERKNKNDKMKI